MYWFTADQHFGHKNIIKYTDRPYKSTKKMDSDLIDRYNEVVDSNDVVYMIGDFTLRGIRGARNYFRRLNGKIYVIPGSHDHKWVKGFNGEVYSASGKEIELFPPLETIRVVWRGTRLTIVLCHYALRVWDKSHYNSYQLHGHSHGNLTPIGKQRDVGVDNNDYYPISLENIHNIMLSRSDNLNFVG